MRKLLLTICCLFVHWCVYGQGLPFVITNNGGHLLLTDPSYNLDAIILLNGIDISSEIKYVGTGTIEWQYNINGTTYNSNQDNLSLDENINYKVFINGTESYNFYTIDYSKYLAQLTDIEIQSEENIECEQITLNFIGVVSNIPYIDKNGNTKNLPRNFILSFENSTWSNEEWMDSLSTITVSAPFAPITIAAPNKSTTFTLYGDEYAMNLGLGIDTIYKDYSSVKIECHLKGNVVEREYKNELDRSSESGIEGSGPLVVEFLSRANPVSSIYYEWFVNNVETPNIYQRYNDVNLLYKFEDSGEYLVKLIANNGQCEFRDSVHVKVLESFLSVPNAFTPNGDGLNDEFRVAYKSLERFSITIQNRWGRTVYTSKDPGKGWDGNINGRPAAEGTYYYFIIAYGYDVDLKGKQVKYKMSGDINLIRSK